MEPSSAFIENLLKTTGISVDDLLERVQKYVKNKSKSGEDVDTFEPKSESNKDKAVIIASQSSNVDTENISDNNDKTDIEEKNKEETITEIEVIEETNVATEIEAIEETHVAPASSEIETVEETPAAKQVTDNSSPEIETFPTISDHDYSDPAVNDDAQQETSFSSLDDLNERENTDDLPKSEDNLRNIIRMQLSSLRNMKKSSGLLPDLEKKSMFFHSLKKKRKSCDFNTATPSDKDNDDQSLVSMSDDTDFMIVNVSGGVEMPDPEPAERSFAVISDICNENKKNAQSESDTNSASPKKQIKNILTNYRRKMSLNYFDTNRYNLISSNGEKPANLMIKKNLAENFNKDPGINKSVKNSEKSPFVSDSLDDFLNESSQLKISYPIPKLGAEEGITENTKKSPFDNVGYKAPKGETTPEPDSANPKDKPKIVKPKTLAEMRRQFEKLKAKEKSNYSVEVRYNPIQPGPERNCFIMYNNKKLFLSGKIKDKCVGVISSTSCEKPVTPKPPEAAYKKPSLLSSLTQTKSFKVNYKPGPLCKKMELQNAESRDKWTTELRTLPKVFLEVVPQVNHPVDPKLVHLLPVFDDVVISAERANFALSVLQASEPKSFTFHVPYNNKQDKMLVRRRFKRVVFKEEPEKKEESDPSKDIAGILDGIINYVEVKEIEDSLIKEDDTAVEEISESVTTKTKGRKAKRKKLDLELLRLNCKVIDVATSETSDKDCPKPYCKLGCVCKSLLCESVFSNHCQLVECMFGCKCPPLPSNEVMTANNSLSAHTVNHLEDKAKKNLAKVEREFTQTLIHTDNDVILLGTGKVRRSSKPPKKYDDYVGNDEIFDSGEKVPSLGLKNCEIPLQKLDLSLLKPFCLLHNVHNCTCKGADDLPSKKTGKLEAAPKKAKLTDQIPKIRIVKTKEDQHKAWYDSCARIRTVFSEYKERNKNPVYNEKLHKRMGFKRKYVIMKKDQNESVPAPGNSEATDPKKPSKRKQSFNIREDVAYDQNKEYALQRRKKKVKPTITSDSIPIFEGEIKVCLKDNKDMLNIIGQENASLEYLRILPWAKLIENFQARKLSIWSKERKSSQLLCNAAGYFPPKQFVDIRMVRQKSDIIEWILTDTLPPDFPRDLMHLILTPKNCNFLIAGYCLKKLKADNAQPPESMDQDGSELCASPKSSESRSSFDDISVGSPEPVEEEKSGTSPTSVLKPVESRPIEINQKVKQQSVLIKKLLNTEANAQPELLLNKITMHRKLEKVDTKLMQLKQIEVLKNSQKSVMLATICKQMQLDSNNQNVKLKSILNPLASRTPPETISKPADSEVKQIPSPKKTTNVQSLIPSRSLKCTHKDRHNVNKTLVLTNKEFANRQLFCNKDVSGGELTIALPKVPKKCTWWMIYLNSDFTYLSFVEAKYSIKYTDLMDVVKMSNNIRSTITLRNKEFTDHYKHPMFGIFCVPEYQNRLFIGPYVPGESHGIETLRYMRGRLVDTKVFNTMFGQKENEKKPMWIYETPVHSIVRPVKLPTGLVIDITEEEDRDVTIVDLDSDEESQQNDSLLCPPFVEQLTPEELKCRNINRYIVTNIPHLGYFGACQRDSRAIEVFWPGGDIGYRFPNVILAKNLLIHYLTQVFCPIPQDFKVNVIIMTHIDTQTNAPVDPKYFSGNVSYFCGEFGVCERHNIPKDLLKKHNIHSTDSLLKSHRESKKSDDDAMTKIFGLFLMSNEELLRHSHTQSILQWAISEIYILKKLAENYESEKTDLKNMIRSNSQKLKDRRKEPETIEITDSDEESSQTSGPSFKKICVSGKIRASLDERSLLKPNIWVKSLVRSGDKRKQESPEKLTPPKSVEISLNNANIVLERNKMLITKIK